MSDVNNPMSCVQFYVLYNVHTKYSVASECSKCTTYVCSKRSPSSFINLSHCGFRSVHICVLYAGTYVRSSFTYNAKRCIHVYLLRIEL